VDAWAAVGNSSLARTACCYIQTLLDSLLAPHLVYGGSKAERGYLAGVGVRRALALKNVSAGAPRTVRIRSGTQRETLFVCTMVVIVPAFGTEGVRTPCALALRNTPHAVSGTFAVHLGAVGTLALASYSVRRLHVVALVMLCYVMLCYVMLCYVMLCYVMLCDVM
jgi:hypothetical protein